MQSMTAIKQLLPDNAHEITDAFLSQLGADDDETVFLSNTDTKVTQSISSALDIH